MPHGDNVRSNSQTRFKSSELFKMLDAATEVTDGVVWVTNDFSVVCSLEISAVNLSAFNLEVRGSNSEDKPAKDVDGFQIGSDITTAGVTKIDMPCRWIGVKLASITIDDPEEDASLDAMLYTIQ